MKNLFAPKFTGLVRHHSNRLRCAFAVLLFVACLGCVEAVQPNLLIIYADDLGWGELSCQGSKDIPTPNIDTIARNDLGMAPLHPYQIILPQIQDAERSVSNEVAMTDIQTASIKKFVAAKQLVDYSD